MVSSSYDSRMKMAGVVYLFDISHDSRQWQGAIKQDFDALEQLWGQSSQNVVILTSKWANSAKLEWFTENGREEELMMTLWSGMLDNGATTRRGYRDQQSAQDTVNSILAKTPTVYSASIQQKMDEFNKALLDTGCHLSVALHHLKTRKDYAALFDAEEDTHLTVLQQTVRYRKHKDSLKICQAKAATFRSFKSERAKTDPGRLEELQRIYSKIRSIRGEIRDLKLEVPFTLKLRVFLDDLPRPISATIYNMTNRDQQDRRLGVNDESVKNIVGGEAFF
ncbi:hypothetical protein DXG01_014897 [Tephrocybe rancida]|nr:hypothetical protein DXG01_014897 [Tephrocybe rancida]